MLMKKIMTLLLAALLGVGLWAETSPVTITIGDAKDGFSVPKTLWGIFIEDINWAGDGGLNPEMLANPGFNWGQEDHEKWNVKEDGWEPDFRDGGMARLSFQYGAPVHPNTAKHLRVETFGKGLAGVRNRGMDGMWFVKGEPYRYSYDWREITRADGIDYTYGPWQHVEGTFVFDGANFTNQFLYIETDGRSPAKGTVSLLVEGRKIVDKSGITAKSRDRELLRVPAAPRTVEFDNVSLQPTGPNLVRGGLRKDLVDKLAALKPAFVRFPGGCIVEEGDFQHWYDWRRTVGPKVRRECVQNRWAKVNTIRNDVAPDPYWETFDIGFYEYFILCEELGAEPLPICLAGLTCQYQRPALLCPVENIDIFAQCILDLIEFANGDETTRWGKVRAEMGHPEPFNLKMVGVGNENWDTEFFDRAEPIAKIIREKHPEITIIGSAGPTPDGRRFTYAWERVTLDTADIVDEHYYCDPKWFLNASKRYDNYARTGKPLVYAGEYACHHWVERKDGERKYRTKINSLWSAVCEAVAMTGFERNSDVVRMTSYAPLFAREGHLQWVPDLIWFNGTESWATPNYYVQQMFSTNRPDIEVPVKMSREDQVFVCAGVKGRETIVKLVNAANEPRQVLLNLSGRAKVTTLTGDSNAENARGKELIKPVTTIVDLQAARPITLPACSVTVIQR